MMKIWLKNKTMNTKNVAVAILRDLRYIIIELINCKISQLHRLSEINMGGISICYFILSFRNN